MSDAKQSVYMERVVPICLVCLGLIALPDCSSGFRMCGAKYPLPYNPSEELCCDGQLHNRTTTDGRSLSCCERQGFLPMLYDEATDICCGPYFVPRFEADHERSCCVGVDKQEFPGRVVQKGQFCCGGNVYDQTDNHGCCGAMDYDVTGAICCEDILGKAKLYEHAPNSSLQCCGTQLYNDIKEYCYTDEYPYTVKPINIQYYKGQEYDSKKQVPCYDNEEEATFLDLPKDQNVRYPKNYGCCNKKLIDVDRYKCCYGDERRGILEHSIIKDDVCCGNSSVRKSDGKDGQMEKCCNGVPNRLRLTEMDENKHYQCCGSEFTNERCCNGRTIPLEKACCGGKEYDRNKASGCCGGQVYNTNDKVCCTLSSSTKTPKEKARRDHNDCCWKTMTSFNNMTQKCTSEGVVSKPESVRAGPKHCPYCTTEVSRSLCGKKNVFVFNITDIKYPTKGTVIIAEMSPGGKSIMIRTPFRCQCLKKKHVYSIFTNRNIKNKGKKLRLRIKGKDMVVEYARDVIAEIEKGCNVRRKVRRTVRRMVQRSKKTGH